MASEETKAVEKKDNAPKKGKGLAIASMVCGICAVVFCWNVVLAIILAIVALALGIVSLATKGNGKGMAIAGVITGGVGLIISAIIAILAAAALNAVGGILTDGMNNTDWSELQDWLESLD